MAKRQPPKLPSAALRAFRAWGSQGAAKRNERLTPAERREIARKAIKARWDKARAAGKAKPKGR